MLQGSRTWKKFSRTAVMNGFDDGAGFKPGYYPNPRRLPDWDPA